MATAAQENPTRIDPCLRHFVNLAFQGKRGTSSGGEKRARRLALCVLENVSGLDGEALEGLKLFIDAASSNYEAACRVIGAES